MNNYSFKHSIIPRPHTHDAILIDVLDGLLGRYLDRVPDANRVVRLFSNQGDTIVNDHIVFRSIHIESIVTIFFHLGYEVRMDDVTNQPFNFKKKRLTGVWLKHPNVRVPRIFVSHFRFDECSPKLKSILDRYLTHWTDPIDDLDLNDPMAINTYLHTAQWPTPTHADYVALRDESEYLACLIYNKCYLNHFTLSVHGLASFNFLTSLNQVIQNYHVSYKAKGADTILHDAWQMVLRKYKAHFTQFNDRLLAEGFNMTPVGDSVINQSSDGCLLQSSTRSAMVVGHFKDGDYHIPGACVEFAYRGFKRSVIMAHIKTGEPLSMALNAER
jgi:hypothetical protein